MAWDKTLPNNSTKIRNYPTVLTANFAAMEEGQSSLQQWKANFIERNAIPSAPPVDPARIDDTMQLYSKQNADGETDLYVIDDRATANVIEISENGRLGGRSQDIVLNDAYFGTDTLGRGIWAVPTIVGSIDGSGGVEAWSEGIASTSVVSSRRRVTFDAGRITNTNYVVQVTPTTGANTRIATWLNKTTGYVDVRITNQNNTDALVAFDIVIWGGR